MCGISIRPRIGWALAQCVALLLLCVPAVAGKLQDAGRATRTSSSSSSGGGSGGSDRSYTSEDCDEGHHHHGSDAAGQAFVLLLTAPWTVPHALTEPVDRGAPGFEDYPYAHGSNGLLRYPDPARYAAIDVDDAGDHAVTDGAPIGPALGPPGRSVAAQVRAEGGYIWGGVYRGRLGARLMMPFRLELDADLNAFAEPRPEGGTDRATFGGGHLAVRFAQTEHVQFRTGIGYQQYGDALGVERGVDLLYGFEAELGARLILSASGNLGTAGHAFVAQARGSLGVMVGPIELYGGYDHIVIGGVELGGPTLGLRGWL
jgi:hypothetical protein